MELVINLRDNEFRIYDPTQPQKRKRFSGGLVSGTYQSSFVIDAQQHAAVIGVHFRPAGAYPFLGAVTGELADTHVDLETLWGRAAIELRERLCAAREPAERFSLLEQALIAHLFRPMEHHYAVNYALSAFARIDLALSVRDVAQGAGLSQRRFIQVFAREIGLPPKLFCRVKRFQKALALVQRNKAPDWMQLVVDCRYFDQSHLIRDFRFFSGLSPMEYLQLRSDRVMENHVPLIPQVNFIQYRNRAPCEIQT